MVENKLNKFDMLFKIILVVIIICITYIFGYPSGKRLMVVGLLVIMFGYWWKYNNGWMVDGSEQIVESWKTLESKYKNKSKISIFGMMALSMKNSFIWIKKFCLIMGIIIMAIGYILLIK